MMRRLEPRCEACERPINEAEARTMVVHIREVTDPVTGETTRHRTYAHQDCQAEGRPAR